MARPIMLESGIKKEISTTLAGEVNVRWSPYNATGDGATDDTTAITTAATAASNNNLVFPAGTYRITGTQAIGGTVTIVIKNGAILQVEGTLTISGKVDCSDGGQFSGSGTLNLNGGFVDVGPAQCFGSSLTANLSSGTIEFVRPEFWGAVGDGSTDDTTAFSSAISALTGGGTVKLSPKTYICSTISLDDDIKISGEGESSVLKQKDNTLSNFISIVGKDNAGIENIRVDGNRVGQGGGDASYGDSIVIMGTTGAADDFSYRDTGNYDSVVTVTGDNKLSLAQSFTVGASDVDCYCVYLYLNKTTGLNALTYQGRIWVEVREDLSGLPSTTVHKNGVTLPLEISHHITTSIGWVQFVFSKHCRLEAGTKYWVSLATDAKYQEVYDLSTSKYVWCGVDASSPTFTGGEWATYSAGSWAADTSIDALFYFGSRTGGSRCFVKGSHITASTKHGIGVYTTDECDISENVVDDAWGTGIMLYRETCGTVVSGNRIIRCMQARYDVSPTYTGDGVVCDNSSSHNTIVGNVISDCAWGVDLQEGASYNSVVGNTIMGNYKSGIIVTPGGSTQTLKPTIGNSITGNTIQQNGLIGGSNYYGIALFNVENTIVANNSVCFNRAGIVLLITSDYNFTLRDCIIANNIVSYNETYGIWHYYSASGSYAATQSENLTLTGNTITNNGYHGIYVDGTVRLRILSNNVSNNNESNGTYYGIYVYDNAQYVEINNNIVADTRTTPLQNYGISVQLGTTANTGVQVVNNYVHGNVAGQIYVHPSLTDVVNMLNRLSSGRLDDSDIPGTFNFKDASGNDVFMIQASGTVGPVLPTGNYMWGKSSGGTLFGMFQFNSNDYTLAFRQMVHQAGNPQTLAAASQIAVSGSYGYRNLYVSGSGGPVTLTSTPSIEAGKIFGQEIVVAVAAGGNTVTLQDEATLAGTTLQLDAATRAIGPGDMLILMWNSTYWCEVKYVNV